MLLKTNRRTSKSRKELKNALIVLMENKSFRSIAITDIVTSAELNRGTFYKYYQTKEDLLNELIDDVLADLIKAYKEPYLHTDTLIISELTSSNIKIFEHVASYANFYTIIVNSNVLPGFQHKICDILKELTIQDLGETNNSSPPINTDLFSSYTAYALFGLIIEWVKGGFKYTSTYMADQLLSMLSFRSQNVIIHTKAKEPQDI